MSWREISVRRRPLPLKPQGWLVLATAAAVLVGCGATTTSLPASRAAGPAVLLASGQAFGIAYTSPVSDAKSRLTYFNSMTGQSEVVGPSADYVSVRLSPDGGTLAALATAPPGEGSTLELIKLSSSSTLPLTLPAGAQATYVAWSPNGSQFVVLGATTLLFDSDGSSVGTASAPVSGAGYSSGGYGWSPDSQYFATIIGGSLVLLGHDGISSVTPLADLLPVAAEPGGIWAFSGWTNDSTISLASFPSGGQTWNITVSGTGPESATPGSAAAAGTQAPPWGPALAAQLTTLVPGGNPVLMWSQSSADGSADVYGIRSSSAPNGPIILALSGRPSPSVVRLPISPQDTRNGALVDVVALGA